MPAANRNDHYDILIAGAGAVGAALACALAGSNYRIGIIEAIPLERAGQTTHDGRGLALSLGTREKLAACGVWSLLEECANPIEQIHVSHRGHFGIVRLDAGRLGLPALGYVVPALRLGRALLDTLEQSDNIDLICPATLVALNQEDDCARVMLETDAGRRELSTRLLVGADGSQSRVRELCDIGTTIHDYGQTAIVSDVLTAQPHNNTAYERFTDSGPFALLPLRDGRCVSVCCLQHETATRVMAASDQEFLHILEQRFGRRLGSFNEAGERRSYPLRLIESERQQQGRILLLGNSVHTIHPNAAQGFNLGLHDASALADILLQQHGDPGADHVLRCYLDERMPVQKRVIRFTHTLAWLFYQPHPLLGPLRTLGMLGLDMLPALQNAFARRAAGLNRS